MLSVVGFLRGCVLSPLTLSLALSFFLSPSQTQTHKHTHSKEIPVCIGETPDDLIVVFF